MNTKNNKRRQRSRASIQNAFVELLQNRDITQIRVVDICTMTNLNRSTFYANYEDIYDLADQIREELEQEVNRLYENDLINKCGNDYLRLFRHIRDHQELYRIYFKLGYDHQNYLHLGSIHGHAQLFPQGHMDYHIAFHQAGINAIIKKWLASSCQESPEEIIAILQEEYQGRKLP